MQKLNMKSSNAAGAVEIGDDRQAAGAGPGLAKACTAFCSVPGRPRACGPARGPARLAKPANRRTPRGGAVSREPRSGAHLRLRHRDAPNRPACCRLLPPFFPLSLFPHALPSRWRLAARPAAATRPPAAAAARLPQVPPSDKDSYARPEPVTGLMLDRDVLLRREFLLAGHEMERAISFGDSRRLRRHLARLMAGLCCCRCGR